MFSTREFHSPPPSLRIHHPPRVSRSLVQKARASSSSSSSPSPSPSPSSSHAPVLARLGTLITRESSSPLSLSLPRRSLVAFTTVSPRVARRVAPDRAPRLACVVSPRRQSRRSFIRVHLSRGPSRLAENPSIDRSVRASPRPHGERRRSVDARAPIDRSTNHSINQSSIPRIHPPIPSR